MIVLQVEGYGETVLRRQLTRFADNLEAPASALESVGLLMRESTAEQFSSQGGNSGGWQELADSTKQQKARLGLDPRILHATGALVESLTQKFDPRHIERVSGDSLTFGSTVAYGVYHQSSRPRTRLPFRPPIALTENDKRRIVKTVQAALIEADRAGHARWGA